MLLPIHIAAGGLAIVLGAVALIVQERRTRPSPQRPAVCLRDAHHGIQRVDAHHHATVAPTEMWWPAVTAYFVGTALTSVRPASSWTRRINAIALTVAVVLSSGAW